MAVQSFLAQLLADTQVELVRTAAAAAMWQARAEMLGSQLEQAQRALPAPTPAEMTTGGPTANGTVEVSGWFDTCRQTTLVARVAAPGLCVIARCPA